MNIIYSDIISDKLKIETKKYVFAILYEIYDISVCSPYAKRAKDKIMGEKDLGRRKLDCATLGLSLFFLQIRGIRAHDFDKVAIGIL